MKKENEWVHMTKTNMIEGPIEKVTQEEIAIKTMRPEKTAEPHEVCAEMTSTRGEVGISEMMELCLRVLDEK